MRLPVVSSPLFPSSPHFLWLCVVSYDRHSNLRWVQGTNSNACLGSKFISYCRIAHRSSVSGPNWTSVHSGVTKYRFYVPNTHTHTQIEHGIELSFDLFRRILSRVQFWFFFFFLWTCFIKLKLIFSDMTTITIVTTTATTTITTSTNTNSIQLTIEVHI